MTTLYSARIDVVAPESLGSRVGLRAGDILLAINGEQLRDIIDVQVYAAEPTLKLLIERDGERYERIAERHYGEPLGLAFTTPLFDGPVRHCRNNCEFCFVAQMPSGLRDPLYVKDDDYRLSFLHGNYITLTNLTEDDWERIGEQYLSPLYVSVHATNPATRVGLMKNPRAGAIPEQLTRLVEMGIEVHTQAVLVPGRNDGAQLDRTIADLAALYPGVVDLSVVPVGLTRWHHPNLRAYTDAAATTVLAHIEHWQRELLADLGAPFVYASDEWYLRAGHPAPPAAHYGADWAALIENGVGMVRRFLDARGSLTRALSSLPGTQQTWVTGTLFAPTLREYAATFTQETAIAADVVAVPNRTFGETVTVAGLLTVGDVLNALEVPAGGCATRTVGDALVLPAAMFRGPQGRALDEKEAANLEAALDCAVYLVEQQAHDWQVVRVFAGNS